jgi:hypothetical protein
MNGEIKREILALAHQAHSLTESAYRAMPAIRGGEGWHNKQRVLLADMALHLLQTSLADGDLAPAQLQRNLYAILNLSANFLPQPELSAAAASLLPPPA